MWDPSHSSEGASDLSWYPSHPTCIRHFGAQLWNVTKMASTVNAVLEVSYIITIIINSITFPLTIFLNVLVIMAVKTRPRLRTNSNILLACLAVTDALAGVLGQPSYILWKIFLLLGLSSSETVGNFNITVKATLVVASCLHLMLVTFERLIAIKFTMHYSNIVTQSTIKIAVVSVWIIAFTAVNLRVLKMYVLARSICGFLIISCIVFVAFTSMILFHETCRHQRKIKAQNLPQEEVKRFTKENKALKTTVLVVCAVTVCLLPVAFGPISLVAGFHYISTIMEPWWQTFPLLNSLVNPLIYCWRQKEIRMFVFRIRSQVGHAANNEWCGVENKS